MRGASPLLPLAAATAFLTRVPVGRFVEIDGRAVARAAPFYPLVGAVVGGLAGAVVDVLAGPLPAWAAATTGVGLAALLTGGMHLDALADTADALGGGTRQRRLEIMRDHSIGSFGAVALVLVLLLEISLLAELGARDLALVSFAGDGDLSRGRAGRASRGSGDRRDRTRQRRGGRARSRGRRRPRPGPLLSALARRVHGRRPWGGDGALANRMPGRRI